jgi:hypothetical protein
MSNTPLVDYEWANLNPGGWWVRQRARRSYQDPRDHSEKDRQAPQPHSLYPGTAHSTSQFGVSSFTRRLNASRVQNSG